MILHCHKNCPLGEGRFSKNFEVFTLVSVSLGHGEAQLTLGKINKNIVNLFSVGE